jgi:5-methylcytosine-specific restriction enzyme A
MGLFDWRRDELILALDLYFRPHPAAPSPMMPEVRDLSLLLKGAALHPPEGRPTNFRSVASVVMKLMNFRSIDPDYRGKGLAAVGRDDRDVWNEFARDPRKLHVVAAAILKMVRSTTNWIDDNEDPDTEGSEGRLLSRLHRIRERNGKIVLAKKLTTLKAKGNLDCEVCGFSFARTYGSRGVDYIECHHRTPLSELTPGKKTRLDDLALLCANCHRMIHSNRPWLTVEELHRIVRSIAGFVSEETSDG